jgi:hypothetical protein
MKKKIRSFSSNQCHWCCTAPKLPQVRFSTEKNSETFLQTSATGAAQRQNFRRANFPRKKFRNFSSNQCHWCRPAPKLPQVKFSTGKNSETSATGSVQRQNFHKLSFPKKKIQKLSFKPVPLVPPST